MIRGKSLAQYNKTFAALILALLTWAGVVVTSDPVRITASEWLSLGGGLAAALGVYAIANAEEPVDDAGQASAPRWVWWLVAVVLILGAIWLLLSLDFDVNKK